MSTEIVFEGAFGYIAEGLAIQQVCAMSNGTLHLVTYDGTGATKAGTLVTEFDPRKARVYTYGQVRRACQKAKTEERLYGTMSLVGAAGGMTRFGVKLGVMKPKSVLEWLTLLQFEGQDAAQTYALMLENYPEEVNED